MHRLSELVLGPAMADPKTPEVMGGDVDLHEIKDLGFLNEFPIKQIFMSSVGDGQSGALVALLDANVFIAELASVVLKEQPKTLVASLLHAAVPIKLAGFRMAALVPNKL